MAAACPEPDKQIERRGTRRFYIAEVHGLLINPEP